MNEDQPLRPAEHFTVEEYLELLGPEDGVDIELVHGRIFYGSEPFFDLVVRYLAVFGLTVTQAD